MISRPCYLFGAQRPALRRPAAPPPAAARLTPRAALPAGSRGSRPHPLSFTTAARAAGVAFLSALIFMQATPARTAAATQASVLEVLRGPVRVVDGDTLVVAGTKIRLFGIDAPEKAQNCRGADGAEYACGAASAAALTERLSGQQVSCAVRQIDMYGRSVATCSAPALSGSGGEIEDVGRWLVRGGRAVAYRAYSRDYVADEESAHGARVGIWAGDFVVPSAWRKQQKASGGGGGFGSGPLASGAPSVGRVAGAPLAVAAMDEAEEGQQHCSSSSGGGELVKGNINARSDRIYHVPGGASYASVAIDADRGERFFCSAAEAEAAGWRPAGKRGSGG